MRISKFCQHDQANAHAFILCRHGNMAMKRKKRVRLILVEGRWHDIQGRDYHSDVLNFLLQKEMLKHAVKLLKLSSQ